MAEEVPTHLNMLEHGGQLPKEDLRVTTREGVFARDFSSNGKSWWPMNLTVWSLTRVEVARKSSKIFSTSSLRFHCHRGLLESFVMKLLGIRNSLS